MLSESELSEWSSQSYAGVVVYDWREVERESVEGYCSVYLSCGICRCYSPSFVRVVFERPRYSRSQRGWVLEEDVQSFCEGHLDPEFDLECPHLQ